MSGVDKNLFATNSLRFSSVKLLVANGGPGKCCPPHAHVEISVIPGSVRKFVTSEDGAALAEYGILVAFIAIVAIVAVTFFGSKISSKFSQLGNTFS